MKMAILSRHGKKRVLWIADDSSSVEGMNTTLAPCRADVLCFKCFSSRSLTHWKGVGLGQGGVKWLRGGPIISVLPISLRASVCCTKITVDSHVAKSELHQAPTREKPAQHSRTALSKARYIKRGDLVRARHAKKESDTKSRRKERLEILRKS